MLDEREEIYLNDVWDQREEREILALWIVMYKESLHLPPPLSPTVASYKEGSLSLSLLKAHTFSFLLSPSIKWSHLKENNCSLHFPTC